MAFKGLWLDANPEAQPEGTYRMAINAVKEPNEFALSTEPANRKVSDLPGKLVGSITMDGEQAILFCEPGYIVLYDQKSESLTTLIELAELDFQRQYPIQGKYKIVNGCERSVYWNDGYHEDRFYNLDSGLFVGVDDFRLVPNTTYPTVTGENVAGGELNKGTYLFVVEVLDNNLTPLIKTIPSQPIRVVEEGQAIQLDIYDVVGSYVRVSALHYTSNNGVTVDAYEYEDVIPVRGSYVRWVYTGRGLVPKDFKSLLSTGVFYDTSRFMESVHGRLLRGNLSEKTYDYSQFQKSASKIKTNYAIQESEDALFTEQGDEVKAYGIVYLMKNGSLSPVFHIPGRNVLDTDLISVESPVKSDVKGVEIDYDVYTWYRGERNRKSWYLQFTISSTGNLLDNVLWTVVTPDGLTYTHRENPTTAILQIPDPDKKYGEKSFNITLTFSVGGIKYSTLVESYTVTPQRIEVLPDNKDTVPRWMVEDTSITSTKQLGYWQSDELYADPVNFCGTDYWGVDANNVSLKGKPVRYHKIPSREKERLLNGTKKRYIGIQFSNISYPTSDVVGHFFVTSSAETVRGSGYLLPYNNEQLQGFPANHRGRFIHYLPNSKDQFNKFYNSAKQNFISSNSLVDKKAVKASYFKVNGELKTINYRDIRTKKDKFFEDDKDLQHYGKGHVFGDTFEAYHEVLPILESYYVPYRTSEYQGFSNRSLNHGMNLIELDRLPTKFFSNTTNMRYTYAKRFGAVFQSVQAIRYRFMNSSPLTGVSNILYAGEKQISNVNVFNVSFIELSGTKQINYEYELIQNLPVESNYDFSTIDNVYYYDGKGVPTATTTVFPWGQEEVIRNYAARMIADVVFDGGNESYVLRESVHEPRYDVLKDIGVIADQRISYPLPISFNYCSDCRGHYPNRIIFSDVNSQEQQSDAWRYYAPLNYQDTPAHRGAITAFDYTGGMLVTRMVRGVFLLQPDPQRIEMSGASLYLGNPQFLGVPAQEIATDASGYGGQQGRLASVVTPSGLFWYDEDAGKVFGYAGQVTELSRNGMYNFFADQPVMQDRAYVQLSYDPYYERVLVHRRHVTGKEVNSFTVSYSMVAKAWVSFHAYQPGYMFYLNRVFYSSIENGLYAHDDRHTFCTFYGKEYDFQVGLVYNGAQTMQWHSVHYYAPVMKWENNRWSDVLNKTFDKAFAYTRKQSTGMVNLLLTNDPTEIITWNERVKTVVQADRNYRIGGLRDMSIADGVLSTNWTDRQTYYNGEQGYQDVVPVNVDYDKPQHEQVMFRDKFIELRLMFKAAKHKMLLYITEYTNLPQNR
jgi:hypothetical protein